jgi:hypothetical protein
MASPLRRTIQTAALSFGPTLARPEVPFLLVPGAQEVSGRECNHGYEREELRVEVQKMLKGERLRVGLGKVDYGFVEEGWCSKVSFHALSESSIVC